MPHEMWDLRRRIAEPGKPASWWKERAEVVHLDTVCLNATDVFTSQIMSNVKRIVPHGVWEEILAEAVHLMKINQEAELSAQAQMPWMSFYASSNLVAKAALDSSRHASLLSTGVAEALLYAAANDYVRLGASLAAAAQPAAELACRAT